MENDLETQYIDVRIVEQDYSVTETGYIRITLGEEER